MGKRPTGRPPGRPRKDAPLPPIDDSMGFGGPAPDPGKPKPPPPPPELVALGPPPDDAAAIQKWNYRLLSTMAALAAKDENLTQEERERRVMKLTQAAARHYPEAARFDLSQKIERDAQEVIGKKRARAAAQAERVAPAGSAKVIPIRSAAKEA